MYGWVWAACSRGALPGILAGPYYDAMLHTVFVGFVFAMIFAHAPIILPAILGRTTSPYQPALYVPLLLLHASLLLRVVGDLMGWCWAQSLASGLPWIDAFEPCSWLLQGAPHDKLHQHQHAQRDAQQVDQADDSMFVLQVQRLQTTTGVLSTARSLAQSDIRCDRRLRLAEGSTPAAL